MPYSPHLLGSTRNRPCPIRCAAALGRRRPVFAAQWAGATNPRAARVEAATRQSPKPFTKRLFVIAARVGTITADSTAPDTADHIMFALRRYCARHATALVPAPIFSVYEWGRVQFSGTDASWRFGWRMPLIGRLPQLHAQRCPESSPGRLSGEHSKHQDVFPSGMTSRRPSSIEGR